jgi:hypothetical protein
VDDFGVKYVGEEHAQHLKNTLEEHYKLTCDWTGTRYIGITLDWDYNKRQVHLSMPNYVKKALKQFQHIAGKLQHSPIRAYQFNMGQEAIRNTGIDCTFVRRQSQMLHSTSMRKILIPGQSSGQHPTLPDQHHSIPIVKTDHRYDAANTSTP